MVYTIKAEKKAQRKKKKVTLRQTLNLIEASSTDAERTALGMLGKGWKVVDIKRNPSEGHALGSPYMNKFVF